MFGLNKRQTLNSFNTIFLMTLFCKCRTMKNNWFFFSIPTRKIQGQENKGERGGKKVTYCFLRHVIGLTLFALKLWMMDPSPSTHCWKTQKHQNTKLRKLKREEVGKFVLGEGSSLQPWIMLITCAEEINCPPRSPYHGKVQAHFIHFTHYYFILH